VIKGHTYLRWQGNVDTLAAVMRGVPPNWDPNGMATWARFTVLWVQRRHREALTMLEASRAQLSRDAFVYQPVSLMRAQVFEAMGDEANARAAYTKARGLIEDSIAARPEDASRRVALGLVLAGLHLNEQAVSEARRAMEMVPLSQANTAATAFMGVAVEVFGRAGKLDEAFELLELLLAIPAGREVTIPYLRLWPGFDPLRHDLRFEPLLDRFATR
jgi:tetratricopeptide (TPR) repeat protein